MPLIPSLQDINIALARLRDAGTAMNLKNMKTDNNLAYSPPVICVTHLVQVRHNGRITNNACESVAMQYRWDHSDWAIYEAIEVARKGEGRVYIEQDIVTVGQNPREATGQHIPLWSHYADEGFSMEVWPTFDGTNKYDKDRNL